MRSIETHSLTEMKYAKFCMQKKNNAETRSLFDNRSNEGQVSWIQSAALGINHKTYSLTEIQKCRKKNYAETRSLFDNRSDEGQVS